MPNDSRFIKIAASLKLIRGKRSLSPVVLRGPISTLPESSERRCLKKWTLIPFPSRHGNGSDGSVLQESRMPTSLLLACFWVFGF